MNAIFTKILLTATAVAALGATIVPAAAQAGEVGNRIADEQHRIGAGVRDGQMTYGEYASTESHLRFIAAQRRFDLRANGGSLTPFEKYRLNRELNVNSGHIYFDNHDWARQPFAPLR
jgi:hypothetical protein